MRYDQVLRARLELPLLDQQVARRPGFVAADVLDEALGLLQISNRRQSKFAVPAASIN